jgi:hypothetical protein
VSLINYGSLLLKRSKRNIPKGYDSWFEYDLHKKFKRCTYHGETLTYTQVKTYEPDFIYQNGQHTIYIEAKGRFRDRAEARKYVDISNCLGEKEELVFVFQNPRTAMPGARRRGDGTRYTMQEVSHGTHQRPALPDGVRNEETSSNT